MPGEGTVAVLLVLLPGFVTYSVEKCLAYQREPSPTLLVARCLAYSLVSYTILATGVHVPASQAGANGSHVAESVLVIPSGYRLLWLLCIAVVIGLLVGAFKAHDWHMWIARSCRLTQRTCREGLWLDVFIDKYLRRGGGNPYVVAHLKDGLRVQGWPAYVSDEYGEGPVLFLEDAVWVDEEGETVSIPAPGIMLNGSQIQSVQLQAHAQRRAENGREPEEDDKKG